MVESQDTQPIRQEQIEDLKRLWHVLYHGNGSSGSKGEFEVLMELSPIAVGVICLVERQPDIILREIGERLSLPKTTLTSLVDRLEQRGFLHRVISPRDRRSYGLVLTELGQQACRQQQAFEEHLWARILGALSSDDERTQFLTLFGKVVECLMDLPCGLHASAGLLEGE